MRGRIQKQKKKVKYVILTVVVIRKSSSDIWLRVIWYIVNDVSGKHAATDVYHEDADRQFWHSEDRASWYILVIKPTRCTISQIYFWNRTLHVSDTFSVHHQDSSTVYTAIGICHTGYADCLLADSQHNLYDIYLLLCIQHLTPDDGQNICPKHVEFYSKNKFEKLVHFFGFIIRI